MSRNRHAVKLFSLAKSWLAGLLALMLVGVAIQSVGHHCGSAQTNHHDCAACQMANGTVLADGSVGVQFQSPAMEVTLELVWNLVTPTSSDLLLSDGRAPPA